MRVLPLILIGLVCSACSDEKEPGWVDFPAPEIRSPAARETPKTGQLLVNWRPLEDRRPEPTAIGIAGPVGGPNAYFSKSIDTWLDGEFKAISGKGFAAIADPAAASIVITPSLLKLYVETPDVQAAIKTAVIVIELNFSYRGGNTITKRIFRGRYIGVNWGNTDEGMVVRVLQKAFGDCRNQIIDALEAEAQKATTGHT